VALTVGALTEAADPVTSPAHGAKRITRPAAATHG
jgi:hypothetical protein